ncbi:hypothetical protein [Dendronalium phyllosphericum]|nr:hypothetical protein [Dendronalium phyllosphericum]
MTPASSQEEVNTTVAAHILISKIFGQLLVLIQVFCLDFRVEE